MQKISVPKALNLNSAPGALNNKKGPSLAKAHVALVYLHPPMNELSLTIQRRQNAKSHNQALQGCNNLDVDVLTDAGDLHLEVPSPVLGLDLSAVRDLSICK